ncbi:hypothetical protein D3C83_13170 [compost metagenome]
MPLLRQRPQRLCEQPERSRAGRQLAGPGAEQLALDPDDVADVVVLERGVRRFPGVAVGDEDLDRAGHVADRGEARLAHHALQHDAAGDSHLDGGRFERGVV